MNTRRKIELEQMALPLPAPRRRVALDDESDKAFDNPHHGHADEDEFLTLRVPAMVAEAVRKDPKGARDFLQAECKRMGVNPNDERELLTYRDFLRDSTTLGFIALRAKWGDYMDGKSGIPATMAGRAGLAVQVDLELSDAFVWETIGYTEWERSEAPPSSGFWDVRQHSAKEGAVIRLWYGPREERTGWQWWNPNPYKTSEEGRRRGIIHDQFMMSHEWRGLKEADPRGYSYELKHPIPTGAGPEALAAIKAAHTTRTRRRIEI